MKRSSAVRVATCLALTVCSAWIYVAPDAAKAAIVTSQTAGISASASAGLPSGQRAGSLEAAASKAGQLGRNVAMSLIGLGFAIASIVLVFRRDFKEAAGVFAVGLLAVLLATPAGIAVLHDTVKSLFGG